ncbi:MAG: hypothetical protein GTO24_16670, partial [candidate division Zixibacteria bacterium]|nr:hypothetical protein [candidate division Zixibacteria bacterium]
DDQKDPEQDESMGMAEIDESAENKAHETGQEPALEEGKALVKEEEPPPEEETLKTVTGEKGP